MWGTFLRGNMKFKKGDSVWMDDNHVDFSRKHRTTRNNRKVSGEYEKFNPADLEVDINGCEYSPSINKNTWSLSQEFDEELNQKAHLLNKGVSRTDQAFARGRSLSRFFDEVTDDFDDELE